MATNTAASFTTHTANGNTDSDGKSDAFNISFSYLAESEIDVTVGTDTTPKTLGTHYEFASATTIKFLSGHVPSNGTAIKFQRDTDISAKKVDFQDGSVLTETDLDNNSDQILFGLQEFVDILNNDTLKRDGSATVTGNFVFEGATDDAHETTLAITDPTADRTITLPNATGNVVLDSATQTLTNKTITATAFTSSNVDINGGAIDGTPIGANSTSTGAFTTATIATGNITTGNITTGNITTGNTTNLTNTQKLKINSGTTSDDGDGTYTVSGGHLTIGSSDANALQLFHDSGNSNSFISEVGTGDLVIVTNGTNLFLQKDATSGHAEDFIQCIANGAVKIFHDSQPKLTTLSTGIEITGNLDSDGITGDSVVTSGTSTSDTKVYSAKRTGELFYGKDTVGEIQSGETWSSADDKVATTAAIDARIIDLVDDVGGFVPIASETVFPNANPDVNNGTGTLISIKEIGSSRTPSGGTVTISNGNAANNATITITGCGSTVLTAGFGAIVETTSTLHTYTFHRLTPKATEVTTVASISSNVTTVAGISSNVTTVAGISSNVTAVAGKTTELTRLGTTDAVADMALLGTTDAIADMNTLGTSSNVTNMNTLAGISSNITTVAGISSNVTTVAGISSNVTAVAGNASNINSAVSNASNINSAVSNASNINSAVSNATNINLVAGSIGNVNNVGGSIASVNTAASNLSSINNFGDKYQIASSDPSTDGGGNSLAEGDLYFNTTANELKVYNGGAWQGGVTASGNFAATTGNTFTGDNLFNDNVKAKFGTASDLEIYHNATYNIIDNASADLHIKHGSEFQAKFNQDGAVEIYYDGNIRLATSNAGISITGTTTLGGDLATNGNDIDFADNDKAVFGTGGDLEIYHDGSNSYITNTTGELKITDTGLIRVITDDFRIYKGNGTELTFRAQGDGACTLFYDNSIKLETTGAGISVTGNIDLDDNEYLRLGSSNDMLIGHAGSSAFIRNDTGELYLRSDGIRIVNQGNDETYIKCIDDGAVELYYDNSKKLETTAGGATVHCTDASDGFIVQGDLRFRKESGVTTYIKWDGSDEQLEVFDDVKVSFGDGHDLQIYHNGTHSFITDTGTGDLFIRSSKTYIQSGEGNNENIITGAADGAVELYYNNAKKFETTSSGVSVSGNCNVDGNITLSDNEEIQFGNSTDFRIYHDGSDSYIRDVGTGGLIINTNAFYLNNAGQTENMIKATENGAVELFYDHSKKLETISEGIETAEKVRMKHGSTVSNVRQTVYQAISNGTSHTFQISNGHGGGTVTVVGIRNGNSAFATTTVFPFALRSTANAGLGSSIVSIGGAGGGFSYNVAGASKGITVTNNDNITGNFYVTFDVTGAVI